MLVTTLLAVFKRERDCELDDDDHVKLNVVQNYVLLKDILKLPSVRVLGLAMLTAKVREYAVESSFKSHFVISEFIRFSVLLEC